MSKRLNIGLFVDDMDAVFTKEALKGAEQGAIAIDANLFVFPGGYLDLPDVSDAHLKYGYQYNSLFSFVNSKHIDVLYIMLGMIGCRSDEEERRRFLERYLGIPIVTMYSKMRGYQSITFDNRIGFDHAITHLIETHGVTHIGYVSGPKTNTDAMERFDVYRTVLERAGIPFRPEYVTYGNFEETSEGVVRQLMLDQPDLQAVVFANDRMAHGGYWAFQKLGINVGKDIFVVSFDNSSFASTLNPPLTTVEANAAELAYQAIANAEQFLQNGKIDDIQVDTHFIRRASCGCMHFSYNHSDQLAITKDLFAGNTIHMSQIYSYLFGDYIHSAELTRIEDILSVVVHLLYDMVAQRSFAEYQEQCQTLFSKLIEEQILRYTTVEKLFNVLAIIQKAFSDMLPETTEKLLLSELFSAIYRNLAIVNRQLEEGQQAGIEQVSQIINSMTGSIFTMDETKEIPYESALENLSSIGIQSAYLYLFQEPVKNTYDTVWQHPKKILCKAYYDEKGSHAISLESQLMLTENITNHPLIPQDHRVTMVLSPLFSGQKLYGLLLSEVNHENFRNISLLTLQLSVALKSLSLLENEREAQRRLEISLEKIKENNSILDEIAKSDELTGLYNRRGFLENAKAAIASRRNENMKAIIIYADMDNLKMINDRYGHDEGDFALKEMSSILKEAFRNTDIVGRFGGDEFVVFALASIENCENIIKRRINEIARRHNEMCNKPYPIELSTGIYEFYCSSDIDIYQILDLADEKLYREKAEKKAGNK